MAGRGRGGTHPEQGAGLRRRVPVGLEDRKRRLDDVVAVAELSFGVDAAVLWPPVRPDPNAHVVEPQQLQQSAVYQVRSAYRHEQVGPPVAVGLCDTRTGGPLVVGSHAPEMTLDERLRVVRVFSGPRATGLLAREKGKPCGPYRGAQQSLVPC